MKNCILTVSLFFGLTVSFISYSQSEVHSGILHQAGFTEENNLLKLHCESIAQEEIAKTVLAEYLKYRPEIQDVKLDVVNKKIYIKYQNEISANYLLGILRRLSIDVFYLDASGTEVRYVKNGTDEFKN